jgi:hypothetical protein
MTPIEILSGIFSIMNGAIVFGQFVLKLADVDPDTRTCILLLERVNKDIQTADELCILLYPTKSSKSRQYYRTIDAIHDTRNAAYELGKLVRVSKAGHVPFNSRLQWVMGDKESFVTREKRLNYCHQALVQVIATMEHMWGAADHISKPQPYKEVASTVENRCLKPTFTSDTSELEVQYLNVPPDKSHDTSRHDIWRTPSQKLVSPSEERMQISSILRHLADSI